MAETPAARRRAERARVQRNRRRVGATVVAVLTVAGVCAFGEKTGLLDDMGIAHPETIPGVSADERIAQEELRDTAARGVGRVVLRSSAEGHTENLKINGATITYRIDEDGIVETNKITTAEGRSCDFNTVCDPADVSHIQQIVDQDWSALDSTNS